MKNKLLTLMSILFIGTISLLIWNNAVGNITPFLRDAEQEKVVPIKEKIVGPGRYQITAVVVNSYSGIYLLDTVSGEIYYYHHYQIIDMQTKRMKLREEKKKQTLSEKK